MLAPKGMGWILPGGTIAAIQNHDHPPNAEQAVDVDRTTQTDFDDSDGCTTAVDNSF
jgi:hypothetical protein